MIPLDDSCRRFISAFAWSQPLMIVIIQLLKCIGIVGDYQQQRCGFIGSDIIAFQNISGNCQRLL